MVRVCREWSDVKCGIPFFFFCFSPVVCGFSGHADFSRLYPNETVRFSWDRSFFDGDHRGKVIGARQFCKVVWCTFFHHHHHHAVSAKSLNSNTNPRFSFILTTTTTTNQLHHSTHFYYNHHQGQPRIYSIVCGRGSGAQDTRQSTYHVATRSPSALSSKCNGSMASIAEYKVSVRCLLAG